MASAIDVIRSGIKGNNWDAVSLGFEQLTGEYVEVGSATKETAPAKKPRGRPKKEVAVVTAPEPVKRSKGKTPTRQEVDESIIVEEREKEEAQTQRVKTGKMPKFVCE